MSAHLHSRRFRPLAIPVLFFLAASCARTRSADVLAFGADGVALELLASDDRSIAAILPLDGPGLLRYSFSPPLTLPTRAAIELEYTMEETDSGLLMVFRAEGEDAWALPYAASASAAPSVIRYRFPLVSSALDAFEIRAEFPPGAAEAPAKSRKERQASATPPALRLRSFRVSPRAYGYAEDEGGLFLSPYVYREAGGTGKRLVVEPPARHRPESFDLHIGFGGGRSSIASGEAAFVYGGPPAGTGPTTVSIPRGALPTEPFPLRIEGEAYPIFFIAAPPAARTFPVDAVPIDPGLILAYRQEEWRDARYEVFRWERFPGILIFDTADYAVQARLFKRLAFFTEKAGFRGRLATDAQIEGLHGWNAHDYRAEDLAAFFETARKTAFPLNAEERELLAILETNGIVKWKGAQDEPIEAGSGSIVSISRESDGYLRSLFMTHEGYHGLFFADEDFRRFAAARWDGLDPVARRFLRAYFDMHRYDVADRYLMMNELMAYCLQQPVSGAAKYFGETLPSRLERDGSRRSALPAMDRETRSWPDLARLLTSEAEAFDAYVKGRWGLRAGSVSLIYQISRTNAAR